MDRTILRDSLFAKYFECQDGILITELVTRLHFITDAYAQLNKMCTENVTMFSKFNSLKEIKAVSFLGKHYLILKEKMYSYVVIDADLVENVRNPKEIFDEDFFVNNFGERKTNEGLAYYNFDKYEGNIQELLSFYLENKEIFDLTHRLSYAFYIDEATTRLTINLREAKTQISFGAPGQFLYEQLFFKDALIPMGMQDAQRKIGLERMSEMLEKVKEIRVPISVIPNDLYQQFLIKKDPKQDSLVKKIN